MQAPAAAPERAERRALRGRSGADGRLLADRRRAAEATVSLGDLRPGEVYLNQQGRARAPRRGRRPRPRLRGRSPGAGARPRRRPLRRRGHRGRRACSSRSPPRSGSSASRARSGPSSSRTAATRSSGAALADDVAQRLQPVAAALGLEVQTVKQDAIEDADAAGHRLHRVLHDLRHVLDRGRHPAHLPDLRDARGRAARRARDRAGDRHAPRPSRRDVHVRGRRLRPRGRGRRRAPRRGRRVRDGARDGEARSAPPMRTRGSRSSSPSRREASSSPFALGLLLTLVVVAVSAWRVSVMTISTAIRNLPGAPGRRGGAAGSCSPASASCSASVLVVSGRARARRRRCCSASRSRS